MSLKKEDLITTCPDCKGEGQIYDTPDHSSRQSCSRCWHTGQIITEEGEVIISLISLAKRQGKF